MSRTILAFFFGTLVALTLANPAICGDLVGTVANGGQAVQGVRVVVHSGDGAITEAATTDASGQYIISGLDPGQYFITLDPSGTGVQGQTVAGYLGEGGLTVNWSVASGTSPLASAQPGIQLTSANTVSAASAATTASVDPPPGCGVNGGTTRPPGPPCGPKKSKKRQDD